MIKLKKIPIKKVKKKLESTGSTRQTQHEL